MKSNWGNISIQISFVTLVFLLNLLAIEGVLRLKGHFETSLETRLDPNGLRILAPNVDKIIQGGAGFPIHVSTDSEGFATSAVIPGSSNHHRIAFLGNSFTMGFEVDQDKKFTSLVGQKLNHISYSGNLYEVMNFGQTNMSPVEQLVLFREYVIKYNPDLVVLSIYSGADFSNSRQFLTKKEYILNTPLSDLSGQILFGEKVNFTNESETFKGNLIKKVGLVRHLVQLITQNKTLYKFAVKIGVFHEKTPDKNAAVYFDEIESYLNPASQAHYEVIDFTTKVVEKLGTEVESRGGKFTVVFIPSYLEVDKKFMSEIQNKQPFDSARLSRVIGQGLSKKGFQFLDLTASFASAINKDKKQVYIKDIGHLTAFGHQLAATEIFKFVQSSYSSNLPRLP